MKKRICLHVDNKIYKDYKITCAMNNTSMSKEVEDYMESHTSKFYKKGDKHDN